MKMNMSFDDIASITAGEVRRMLDAIPDDARMTISTHQADMFGTDWHTVKFEWTVE